MLFAFLFFIEMLLKMAALGLPSYLSNGFNKLDSIIVFCSIFELIAAIAGLQAADILNALRALRVPKLASNLNPNPDPILPLPLPLHLPLPLPLPLTLPLPLPLTPTLTLTPAPTYPYPYSYPYP